MSPVIGASGEPFDGAVVAKIYDEVRMACRQGEAKKGEQLTSEESQKQCYILDALGDQLKSHGYCWDNAEQEWTLCK